MGQAGFGLILLLCGWLQTAAALAVPPPIFGAGFGINIKTERITPAELDRITALGIKRVRIGLSWYDVERERGVYRWDYAQQREPAADDYTTRRAYNYDDIIEQIRARGLHIDATLHESNGLYTGDNVAVAGSTATPPDRRIPAPRTPAAIEAFAAFAAATVQHYQARYGADAFTWHIWNEPDQNGSFAPASDGAVFGQLMATTCAAIRQAAPESRIMGPALSAVGDGDFQYDFIAALFTKANPLSCLDAFTVHPYRAFVPETATADYVKLRQFLARWQPAKPVPIAVDEWGASTAAQPKGQTVPYHERWRDFSDREQAALMLRFYLTNLAAGLPLTVLYDWRDRGTDPTEREDRFGMVTFAGQDKPTITMLRTVWPILAGRPLLSDNAAALSGCSPEIKLLQFGGQAADSTTTTGWLVAWRATPYSEHMAAKPVELILSGTPQPAHDIFGQPVMPAAAGRLPLSGIPWLLPYALAHPPRLKCVSH
jgi:polysaccharide biosynthesis protein PslG